MIGYEELVRMVTDEEIPYDGKHGLEFWLFENGLDPGELMRFAAEDARETLERNLPNVLGRTFMGTSVNFDALIGMLGSTFVQGLALGLRLAKEKAA